MEKRLFKHNHYVYAVLCHEQSLSLWAYNKGSPDQHSPPYYFLGSVRGGILEPIRMTDKLPWDIYKGMERLYRRVSVDLSNGVRYDGRMKGKREANPDRDLDIATKVKEGMSYRRIAKLFGMAVSSVFQANARGVRLMEKLSTK